MQDPSPPRRLPRTVLVALAVALAACSEAGRGAAAAPRRAAVRVATAVERDVPVELEAVGRIVSAASVQIRAQVSGTLLATRFTEGQPVREGQVLVEIDPRPYAAAVAEARARLAQDRVRAENARADATRYAELAVKEYVARQQLEAARANAAALEAQVAADEAALERARLNLAYCTIRAPISGRAGKRRVDPGNLVAAGGPEPLVTLEQVKPVFAEFAVPERNLAALRAHLPALRPSTSLGANGEGAGADRAAPARTSTSLGANGAPVRPERSLAAGEAKSKDAAGPPVTIRVAGGAVATGTLTFIDNAVDPATGTVLLRARIPNEDEALWPGQSVEARVRVGERRKAVVVPAAAVAAGQQGDYAYVVGPDRKAQLRHVVVALAGEREAVLSSGVAAGEQVVVDGQLKLRPGAAVELLEDAPQPGTAAPSPAADPAVHPERSADADAPARSRRAPAPPPAAEERPGPPR